MFFLNYTRSLYDEGSKILTGLFLRKILHLILMINKFEIDIRNIL